MARVDHKKIRQLIAQKQKTVTDRQFFSSRAFAAYFADMALAQTRRYGYHRRVKVRTVWEPKNGNTAMTNNELIWLNAGHPSITQHKSRAERYAQLCGLFAHELGHVLYTDFITSQTHLTRLDSGFWSRPLCAPAESSTPKRNCGTIPVTAESIRAWCASSCTIS